VITRLRIRIAGPVLAILGLVLVLVLVLGVGRLLPQEPLVALAIAVAVLLLGLTLADPTIIPQLAVPVLLVVVRVRLGGPELSASDLVLFLAVWPAVALGQRPYSAPLRTLLWLVTLYQAATLFAVVNNPYTANTVEWLHAALLTAGALVVGWALGRAGRGAVACSWPGSESSPFRRWRRAYPPSEKGSSRSTHGSPSRCTRTSPAAYLLWAH
jgi:hypothetical protein